MQKKKMSKLEANIHQNNAGVKASQAARNNGEDPGIVGVILNAAGDMPECCGWKMHPLTVGTTLVIIKLEEQFNEWVATQKMDAVEAKFYWGALNNMVFADPKRVLGYLKLGMEAIIPEADRLIYDVPMNDRKPLIDHMNTQLALLDSIAPADSPQEEEKAPAGNK